jgi:hypothetical protein
MLRAISILMVVFLLPVSGLAAFPQVASVTETTFTTNAVNHLVAMPATVNAGDLLLVLFATDGAPTITTPSGWDQLLHTNNGSVRATAYTKVAIGTEGGTTVDFVSSAGEEAAAQVYRITAWYGSLDGVERATSATGTSANPNPPTDSPSWGAADTLWLAVYFAPDGNNVTAYPANYTNGLNTESGNDTEAASMGSARRELNAAAEDPGAFTIQASIPWIAQNIQIRPSAAPPPPALYDCDFETLPLTTSCDSSFSQDGNTRDTFANFGIPQLPGGGDFILDQNSTSGVDDANRMLWYNNKNATSDPYFRFYFYIPAGYTSYGEGANVLKFILFQDQAGVSPFQNLIKLWEDTPQDGTGDLRLNFDSPADANPRQVIPDSVTITRDEWHYIEVHVDVAFSGSDDLIELWFDSDSRYNSPTWSYQADFTEDTNEIDQITTNENWSGNTSPETQVWYIDGAAVRTTAIGDTYGLLPPPPGVSIEADNEEGDLSDYLNGCQSGNGVDTFSNFGVVSLTGGGTYAVNQHATSGIDDSDFCSLFYNNATYESTNGWMRAYILFPSTFILPTSPANGLKVFLLRSISPLSGDQDLYGYQTGGSGSGKCITFNWQHSANGYNSGDILSGGCVSRDVWHYIEINISSATQTIKVWFDVDAALNPSSPTWTNSDETIVDPYDATDAVSTNDNYSGSTAPQTQDWFLDGLRWDTASAIGDTYGLLGAPPAPGPVRKQVIIAQ